jgi:hypothetical protein
VSLATTGIEEDHSPLSVPESFTASPNPFTAATTIRSSSPLAAGASLRLYDAVGNLVRSLPAQGSNVLSGSGLKPGVYVLRAGNQSTRLVKAAN